MTIGYHRRRQASRLPPLRRPAIEPEELRDDSNPGDKRPRWATEAALRISPVTQCRCPGILVSRYGVATNLTVWDIVGLRYASAALLSIPVLITRRHRLAVTPSQGVILAVTSGAPYALLAIGAAHWCPPSHLGAVINGTVPIAAATFAVFWLRRTISVGEYAGILLITAGICGLLLTSIHGATHMILLGDGMLIIAGVLLAAYMVVSQLWHASPLDIIAYVPTISAAVYLPIWYLFLPVHLEQASTTDIALQAFYQGVLVTVAAVPLLGFTSDRLGADRAAFFVAAIPILATTLGVPILHETLRPLEIAAVIVSSMGITVAALSRGGRLPRPKD